MEFQSVLMRLSGMQCSPTQLLKRLGPILMNAKRILGESSVRRIQLHFVQLEEQDRPQYSSGVTQKSSSCFQFSLTSPKTICYPTKKSPPLHLGVVFLFLG